MIVRRTPRWPDPRVKPPYGSVEVDWGHPLAQGLRYCWLLNEMAGLPIDIVSHSDLGATRTSGVSWSPGVSGPGLTFAAVSDAISLNPLPHGNGNITVIGRGRLLDTGAHAMARISGGASGGVNVYRFRHQNASNWAWELFNIETEYSGFGGTAGNVYSAAASYTLGSGVRFHIKDLTTQVVNAATVNTSATPYSGTAGVAQLGEEGTFSSWQDYLAHVAVYSRALPDAELAQLHDEPYAFLRPVLRRRYFVPTAGAARVVPRRLSLLGVGS